MWGAWPRNTEMSCGSGTSIVVFASGKGTNFRALCEAAQSSRLSVRIVGLVTNVSDAGAATIAREFGVPVIDVPHAGLKREAHEQAVLHALEGVKHEWAVLAGYMRLFTPAFIRKYYDEKLKCARVVNIHPSLLPAFAGADGYAQALRYGVKLTGATVHLVGDGLDDGPIVAQRAIDVRDDDTESLLVSRGLKVEHELYVETLQKLLTSSWRLVSGNEPNGRLRVLFEGGLKR